MPQYFFTFSNGATTPLESHGIELPDLPSVWIEATRSTGDILRDLDHPIEPGTEMRMQVADETRKPLLSLRVIAESHK